MDISQKIEGEILNSLLQGNQKFIRNLALKLHYADLADLLERLSSEERTTLIKALGKDVSPEMLVELDDNVRDEIISVLAVDDIAGVVSDLDSDDAVDFLEELDEQQQFEILESIPAEDRILLRQSLSFPPDTAGRLMQREVVTAPEFWNVGHCIDFMRRAADDGDGLLPKVFYDIFVVDPGNRVVGAIPLSNLLRVQRNVLVTELMETNMTVIPVLLDQEDVAFMFRQRDLVSAPVVDEGGRLVGAITIDDVVDVIQEEHEEDIMRMGGIIADDLYVAAIGTVRARFSWLVVNLITAIAASLVIHMFDASIEQMVALAVLMPIIASMGGNAGTQTLTVTVRALATKELNQTNAIRLIGKELLVGSFNGILFALISGVIAWCWFDNLILGTVVAAAMIVNMVVAGLAGSAIPIVLNFFKHDPAIASSVFVTTVTDVVGFFAFLGFAATILL
ncbi:MAG: magnesium transporter [Magnetovibrio sp.]|nr:magnesium transporter [Magnetovibrio sp.]